MLIIEANCPNIDSGIICKTYERTTKDRLYLHIHEEMVPNTEMDVIAYSLKKSILIDKKLISRAGC